MHLAFDQDTKYLMPPLLIFNLQSLVLYDIQYYNVFLGQYK